MTGNFFIDEDIVVKAGITDLKKYQVDKDCKIEDLLPDGFI